MTILYCILAREADTAVIFRRGPSKLVRLIRWTLRNDTFQPGQWLLGRIYERKSDLSPDGEKLVYMAANYKRDLRSWIAVSNPPYLTALVLWGANGTWNDISLFETNNFLALATYRLDSSTDPYEGFDVPRQLRVRPKPWPGHFYRLADHDRLIRDGWSVNDGDPIYRGKKTLTPVIYRKSIWSETRSAKRRRRHVQCVVVEDSHHLARASPPARENSVRRWLYFSRSLYIPIENRSR